jgi:predicted protein tyrosine phosphatase
MPVSAHHHSSSSLDPAAWWRRLGWVTDRIAVCGDLPESDVAAQAQLDQWQAAGVSVIVDVRGEHSDASRVAEWAPHITYIHLGTHDSGGAQDHAWFVLGVEEILSALAADPAAKVVIHCHMGVNRAPSMAVAVLLAMGYDGIAAVEAVRAARPIAAAIYADQALDVHLWLRGVHSDERAVAIDELKDWMRANPVDMSWVISRIRRAEWDEPTDLE